MTKAYPPVKNELYEVSHSSMLSLQKEKWLCDEVINGFMAIL